MFIGNYILIPTRNLTLLGLRYDFSPIILIFPNPKNSLHNIKIFEGFTASTTTIVFTENHNSQLK